MRKHKNKIISTSNSYILKHKHNILRVILISSNLCNYVACKLEESLRMSRLYPITKNLFTTMKKFFSFILISRPSKKETDAWYIFLFDYFNSIGLYTVQKCRQTVKQSNVFLMNLCIISETEVFLLRPLVNCTNIL